MVHVPLGVLRQRHPEAVEMVVAKHQKRRGKVKGIPVNELEWGYYWVSRGRAYRAADLMDGTVDRERAQLNARSFDERLADSLERRTLYVAAYHNQWRGTSEPLTDIPQEVFDFLRSELEMEEATQAIAASSNPVEINQILVGLNSSGLGTIETMGRS